MKMYLKQGAAPIPYQVFQQRFKNDLFSGPSFAARCLICKALLTQYDETPEQAELIAEAAAHNCMRLPEDE